MTNTIYIHQPEKAFSFTRLPNFLFEAPTFQPLSNEAKVLYAFVLRRAELSRKNGGGRVRAGLPVLPHLRGGRFAPLRAAESGQHPAGVAVCGAGGNPEQGAVENPTAFTRNPMKRFQTPTSRNPVMVRRRAENRTWRILKSNPLEIRKNRRYIEIQRLKPSIYIILFQSYQRYFFGGKTRRKGMEWGKGVQWHNTQFCDLRSTRATRRLLEAHHERKKEQYASNPDIDTSRSKYNFHIVKPDGRYYHFIQSRIEQARCRTRKDSTRFVDTLITASPEFFKGKSPKEIAAYFQRAADFLIDRVGRENIVSAMVHMDEKTPHLHLVFVPLTKDNRLCAKEIIGNRANLTKWQDDFHACMVEQYPDLERGESASKTGRKHIPTRLFKQAVNLSKQARAIEAVLSGITPLNAGRRKKRKPSPC